LLLVAVSPDDIELFPTGVISRIAVRNTTEALKFIQRERPHAVAIDWDDQERFDRTQICAAARQLVGTGVLATMGKPEAAPSALKAGCHAILLKPLTLNLVAARLGRLLREVPGNPSMARIADALGHFGTHRKFPERACPNCSQAGVVSFEHASHRRSWYACLSCDSVWLGRRQE